MYNLDNIASFLYYGYLPRWDSDFKSSIFPDNDLMEIKEKRQGANKTRNESIIIDKGIQALKASFKDADKNDRHIVPLSGGLDSRTILAGLLDAGLKESITAVTFGTPGTWDYELGSHIARKLELRHESINLSKIRIEESHLLKTAENGSAWTYMIDAYFNSLICKKFGVDAIYWSGFMGDNIAGSHLPPEENQSWPEAKKSFAGWNHFTKSTSLFPSGFIPEDSLPPSPLMDDAIISYDDALDFFIRQQNYIKPTILTNGYTYKTPFTSSEWVKFILTVPRAYRENNYIYQKIIMKAFPDIISFPAKNTYGGRIDISKTALQSRHILSALRNKISFFSHSGIQFFDSVWNSLGIFKDINYIDFDYAIRNREDLKHLVLKSINDLKKRNILDWLDLDGLWSAQQKTKSRNGKALMLLTALEISLKTTEA